jgi:hypothetical protein
MSILPQEENAGFHAGLDGTPAGLAAAINMTFNAN